MTSTLIWLFRANLQNRQSIKSTMTNQQARLIGCAIAILGGAVAATTENLDINFSIAIMVISGTLFLAEYIRSQKN